MVTLLMSVAAGSVLIGVMVWIVGMLVVRRAAPNPESELGLRRRLRSLERAGGGKRTDSEAA